jgi:hypothetical protein
VNYLVLHVRPYSFRDDSNRLVEGASVTYLDLSNEPDEGEKGFAPLTITATTDKARGFTEVPGYYDLSFSQRRGAKGRPQIVFDRARLVTGVDFGMEVLTDTQSQIEI